MTMTMTMTIAMANTKQNLPLSIRKHIRKQKARVRREYIDPEKQDEKINKLYQEFLPNLHKSKNGD